MKWIMLVSLLAFLLCGCSTTYTVVEPSSGNPFTEKQLTRHIKGDEVTVEFMDGTSSLARDFRVEDDSCSWVQANSGSAQRSRTTEIRRLIRSEGVLGAFEGMGLGVLGGTVISGLAALGKGGGEGGNGLAVVFGIAVGGAVGTAWGLLSGHSTEYEFEWFETTASSTKNAREQRTTEHKKRPTP